MLMKKALKTLFFFSIVLSHQWAIADQKPDSDSCPWLVRSEYDTQNQNESRLAFAILSGRQELARELLSQGANPNISLVFYDPSESARLNLQIEVKSKDVVLLAKSAETAFMFEGHHSIFFSTTLLHLAVRNELPSMVELLLKSGVKSNAQDGHNQTPFEMLAYTPIDPFQTDAMIQAFIENSPEQIEVIRVYHHAVMARNVILARSLIDHGRSYLPEDLFYPQSFFMILSNNLPSDAYSSEYDMSPDYRRMYELLVQIGVIAPRPSLWERVSAWFSASR